MANSDALSEQYNRRFEAAQAYRDGVWQTILKARLQNWVGEDRDVLDLGCGWGEFIRNVQARSRHAMDLNPDAAGLVGEGVSFIQQDCSQTWPLQDASLDVVFSSNFIEHLPDKAAIETTLVQARRCLREQGRIIFLGPNVRYVPGAYWDFWDHHVPITDKSLVELLELSGFEVEQSIPRFLPYTMSEGREAPLALVRLYLALPIFWPLLGKQFLVVARTR
jgi:ubiquinone/menaquinone biosynthesis C-methylase UbiE